MGEQRREFTRRSMIGIGAGIAVVPALVGSVAAAVTRSAAEGTKESWLYVLDAESATADGRQLTLLDVDPIGIGFTDRPQRKVARFAVSKLMDKWADMGFVDDPPNAAVAWFDGEEEHTIVVELSQPSETASGLGFAYRELEKPPTRLRSKTATVQAELPASLGDVVIFIDHAYPTSVNDQVTD